MDLNYNVARINKNNAILDGIITGQESKEEQRADQEMLRLSKPSIWNVYMPNNAELEHEVGFELFLMTIAESAGLQNEDIGEWTMFRFYNLRLYLLEKNKNG